MHPYCHNTLTMQHILIECVLLADLRIIWKFPATLENLFEEDVNLNNLIKFLHVNELYYEI